MRTALLLLSGGAWLAVAIWWRRRKHNDAVSQGWLQEQARSTRVDFQGVSWCWPIDKVANDRGWRNRQQERKRA